MNACKNSTTRSWETIEGHRTELSTAAVKGQEVPRTRSNLGLILSFSSFLRDLLRGLEILSKVVRVRVSGSDLCVFSGGVCSRERIRGSSAAKISANRGCGNNGFLATSRRGADRMIETSAP
jgi:hypothetical protein